MLPKPSPAPFPWFGGKAHILGHILPFLDSIPHRTFVDVFGGSGAVLLGKKPRGTEVYNDLDGRVVNFFRVLSDPRMYEEFERRVAVLPFSRRLFKQSRRKRETTKDPIQAAVWWFVSLRQAFSGLMNTRGWNLSVRHGRRGMGMNVSKWLGSIDNLPLIHARLQRVSVECHDWRKILDIYDTPDTLFYLDPPYVPDTRRDGGYTHEMTLENHVELISYLLQIQGHAVLSGYVHETYSPLVEKGGWKLVKFDVPALSVGRTRASSGMGEGSQVEQRREECLWIKPYQCREGLFQEEE